MLQAIAHKRDQWRLNKQMVADGDIGFEVDPTPLHVATLRHVCFFVPLVKGLLKLTRFSSLWLQIGLLSGSQASGNIFSFVCNNTF